MGGTVAYGTATILDDGTGKVFLPVNTSGSADPPSSPGYPTVLDDDRMLSVGDLLVNEGSPYAVFTVTGAPGQIASLALAPGATPVATGDGVDYGAAAPGSDLEIFDGSRWVAYGAGTRIALDATGQLKVRTAVVNDSTFEGAETFRLTATNASGTPAFGTATILDDGTGAIYPDNPTGNPDPDAVKDDDRAVKVNDIEVNEGSPYAVFTVKGTGSQAVVLGLQQDNDPLTANALLGTDTGHAGAAGPLQVFNGTAWVDYTPGAPVNLVNGQLLVRTRVTQDTTYEGPESFALSVAPVGGTAVYGTATILDDGTGAIYPDNPTGNPDPDAVKDDDRAVKVNDIEVNEGSPYAVFTVKGTGSQAVVLGLQQDNDPLTANALLGTDTGNAGATGPLQVFNGTAWVDYTPGAPVNLVNGQLLVRTRVTQDTTYEGPESFVLSVAPVGGTVVYGTATLRDDGRGAIFRDDGSINPDAPRDDDRAVARLEATPRPSMPAVLAWPVAPSVALHVQLAVAQAQTDRSVTSVFGASSPIVQTSMGGVLMAGFVQAHDDAFAPQTDPNLFVLPAVRQARYQALEVQIPSMMRQSGLLDPLEMSRSLASPAGGLTQASTHSGETLADQTLAALSLASEISPAVLMDLQAQQDDSGDDEYREFRKRFQLDATRLATEASIKPKGHFGFSQQLKMSAQPSSVGSGPRT